ncbi:uncharacterized protein LAESUDRAFT_718933 [Laetiporus sulphureus 93-53]|uniref:Uncharacterized protein n=1 Tax=Laetiporus sulphureus 93-53 TaxID=1314785 RepID=A0A165I6B4_9APHY|nr:uncharacterized protein LAESUDRAFT_718933 [Laetiporus sulphureus 93-53]KZT12650.1 hypothetical protein LAESUDRAFT_718933 [Laetiporus sulphureus 93-53]
MLKIDPPGHPVRFRGSSAGSEMPVTLRTLELWTHLGLYAMRTNAPRSISCIVPVRKRALHGIPLVSGFSGFFDRCYFAFQKSARKCRRTRTSVV